jgi:predicted AlkP superfamily pyrophosphatase or phosphodiesterase
MDNFVFFHFRGPDSAGHSSGWGNAGWDDAVKKVDRYLIKIFEMVKDSKNEDKPWYCNTAVIITADHGGIGKFNGGYPGDLKECQLPFGVWGHLIPKGVDA